MLSRLHEDGRSLPARGGSACPALQAGHRLRLLQGSAVCGAVLGSVWSVQGLSTAPFCYFITTRPPCPRHPAPRPVPAAQTGDACQDAALSRCGVILSNPPAGAQQLSPCSKGTCTTSWGCQRSWAPRVPGSAHSPVSAVGDGVSCTTAHIPQFLVEPSTERVIQPWAHETVSVSQCNGG